MTITIRTTKQFQEDLDAARGKAYKLVGPYTGRRDIHTFKHLLCGKKFETVAEGMTRGTKCPCERVKPNFDGKTLEAHQQEVREWRGKDYECLKFSRDGDCTYLHKVCGKTFKTTWRSFKLSKHCLHCSGGFAQEINRLTPKEAIKRLHATENGKEYEFVEEYWHIARPHKVKHLPCGRVYKAIPESLWRGQNQCVHCYPDWGNPFRIKTIEVRGKTFKLQGFEPRALEKLMADGHKAKDIIAGTDKRHLRIPYEYGDTRSSYRPDFWLPKANVVIEVKSVATLGLDKKATHIEPDVFYRNCAKAAEVIRKGYRFKLFLYEKGRLIRLPRGWYEMRRSEVRRFVRSQFPIIH